MEIIVDRSVQKIIGMIIGFLCCWLGYKLFLAGVGGEAKLSVQKDKIKFQLLNAAPGIFFLIAGAIVIGIGLFQKETIIKIKKDGETRTIITKGMEEFSEYGKYYSRGMELIEKEDSNNALSNFEKAFAALPDNFSRLYNNLAYLYAINNENLDEGMTLSKMSLLMKPDEPIYYHTLSQLYLKKGDVGGAIQNIKKAIKFDPQNKKYKDELTQFERRMK